MPTEHENGTPTKKKKKHGVDPKTAAALQKVSHLVQLAHENENEEEARTAALTAINLMHEYELVVFPRREIERLRKHIEGTNELAREAKKERLQNMGLGFIAGMMLKGAKIL